MTWTPVRRGRLDARGGRLTDTVKALGDGSLVISNDLVERIGGNRVGILTNSDPSKLGLRAFTNPGGERGYRLTPYTTSDNGKRLHAAGILWHLNRRVSGVTKLAHSWDDAVLVIDLSSLPKREG